MRIVNGPPQRYAAWGSGWMLRPQTAGGGALLNLGIHGVDAFLHLTGEAPAVAGAALWYAAHRQEVEDFGTVVLRAPGGAVGTVEAGYTYPDASAGMTRSGDNEVRVGASGAYLIARDADVWRVTAGGEEVLSGARGGDRYRDWVFDSLARLRDGRPPWRGWRIASPRCRCWMARTRRRGRRRGEGWGAGRRSRPVSASFAPETREGLRRQGWRLAVAPAGVTLAGLRAAGAPYKGHKYFAQQARETSELPVQGGELAYRPGLMPGSLNRPFQEAARLAEGLSALPPAGRGGGGGARRAVRLAAGRPPAPARGVAPAPVLHLGRRSLGGDAPGRGRLWAGPALDRQPRAGADRAGPGADAPDRAGPGLPGAGRRGRRERPRRSGDDPRG